MTNPTLKDICKVGYTNATPHIRATQLSSTAAAADFEVAYALPSQWAEEIEQQAHRILKEEGRHTKREFFKGKPKQMIDAIKKAEKHVKIIANNKNNT
jgi:hypothetical protein